LGCRIFRYGAHSSGATGVAEIRSDLSKSKARRSFRESHIGTIAGRKGSAPLGRAYFLWSSDFDRVIYDAGVFKIRLGPFLDSGKITDPSGVFGTNRWLWDTGLQVKLSLLSTVTLSVSYGRDLRTGRNAFYAATARP
jgi:hypothetical protein